MWKDANFADDGCWTSRRLVTRDCALKLLVAELIGSSNDGLI